eukprot:COSAG01_NODE_14703_length_1420_cov_1.488266_2_plen_97_part_00
MGCRSPRAGGGESFLRVHWVAVPEAMRVRRLNRRTEEGRGRRPALASWGAALTTVAAEAEVSGVGQNQDWLSRLAIKIGYQCPPALPLLPARRMRR